MAEKTHFVKQVFEYLYPAKNRVIAAVAFVRTFKQTLTGSLTVGGTGLIAVNATDIAQLTWDIVMYAGIAVLLSALLSAGVAFDDVSRNGLNSKYMDAANLPAPAVVISPTLVGDSIKQLNAKPAEMKPAPAVNPAATPVAVAEKKAVGRKKAAEKELASVPEGTEAASTDSNPKGQGPI